MIQIPFYVGMGATLFGWLLYRIWAWKSSGKLQPREEGKLLFFLVNLLVIVRFTFYPFSKIDGQVQPLLFDPATAYPFRLNLIPFVNLLDYEIKSELIINLVGNTAMFIPTGIMVPLLYPQYNSCKKVMLFGATLSLIIEILQLPFAVRASDVDDLILNTAGCLAGYGLYALGRGIGNILKRK